MSVKIEKKGIMVAHERSLSNVVQKSIAVKK